MAKIAVTYNPDLFTKPPLNCDSGARFNFRSMAVTKAALELAAANNSILAIGVLPAGHRLCSLFLESANLSDGSDLVADIGILNHYYGKPEANVAAGVVGFDLGVVPALASGSLTLADGTVIVYGNILTGATIVRAGGRVDALVLATSVNIGVDMLHDRIIAINITTPATTGKAGNIAIGFIYDAA